MPIQNIETKNTRITTTTFRKTSTIPTYAIAITLFRSSDFPYFSKISYTSSSLWYHMQRLLPYMKFAKNLVSEVIWYLNSILGDFELDEKMNHIAIPGFLYDSTENLGLVFYRYYI